MRKVFLLSFVAILLGGCASRTISNTPRTAIEQLLLSAAVDRALEKFDVPEVDGKKVFVDTTNLKAYDQEYVIVATRARLARLGARLVATADEADYTAELASGGLGTEFKNTLVGIPSLPMPNSPIGTPEAPVYKRQEQTGIVKLLIFLHDHGKFIASGHYYAKADRDERFLLWFRFQLRDEIRVGWDTADLKLESQQVTAEPEPASQPGEGL